MRSPGIIFWGVIRPLRLQRSRRPGPPRIPPLLFMIMTWFGASYNVRLRTHLSFAEFRSRHAAEGADDACLCAGRGAVVHLRRDRSWSRLSRVAALSASNFQIVLGTDNVLQWWFLVTAPSGLYC